MIPIGLTREIHKSTVIKIRWPHVQLCCLCVLCSNLSITFASFVISRSVQICSMIYNDWLIPSCASINILSYLFQCSAEFQILVATHIELSNRFIHFPQIVGGNPLSTECSATQHITDVYRQNTTNTISCKHL